jgi:hypothetical protein
MEGTGMRAGIVLGILLVGTVAGTATAALTQPWAGYSGSTASFLYDSTGTQLTSSGLQIQLIVDTDGNTDFSLFESGYLSIGSETKWAVNSTAVNDTFGTWDGSTWTYIGSKGAHGTPGTTSLIDESYNDVPFYFRWFNGSDINSATEAGFIYSENWSTPADPGVSGASVSITYGYESGVTGTTYTPGSNDGWATVAAVPEPGTMALFAIGLVTLAVRRRRR